jgi:four helix bundle protein
MSTFKKFEEIDAWRNCRVLAKAIYEESCRGTFARDFKLKDQMNGSCGSVMDNIAEGFERDGNKEFIQFLSIAKGSAGELQSQLYRSLDRKHIGEERFESFSKEIRIISDQIGGLIKYLKNTELKGKKFKPKLQK